MKCFHVTQSNGDSQQGFVLPVAMVMLIVLSFIGVSTMRDGTLQERMSSNFLDKEKSFQSAESALRAVQRLTLHGSAESIAATANYHSTEKFPLGAPDYENIILGPGEIGFEVSQVNDTTSTGSVFTTSTYGSKPYAMIEEMRSTDQLEVGQEPTNPELAKRFFRITTQGTGDTNTARTTLQGVAVR